ILPHARPSVPEPNYRPDYPYAGTQANYDMGEQQYTNNSYPVYIGVPFREPRRRDDDERGRFDDDERGRLDSAEPGRPDRAVPPNGNYHLPLPRTRDPLPSPQMHEPLPRTRDP